MKSIILCLCILGLQSFVLDTYSQTAKLSLSIENKTVNEVLKEIEKRTDFYFTYNSKEINTSQRVTINREDEDVTTILGYVFPKGDVGYSINGKHIVLYKKDSKVSLGEKEDIKQEKKVTGIVRDQQGEPLIGVSIQLKETSQGTITDIDGRFEINSQSGKDILVIAYIGYQKQEVTLGQKTHLDILLKEDVKQLEEVVVVGYATQRRANLTGSVFTVSADVLESRPVNNPLSALQGEIPGMLIQRSSGQPGKEDFKMNVRGQSSTNGDGAPLIIIDGVAGDLNLLSSDDIESITVLKDAQASIYGARAAGGVVLVTTKKGKQGVPRINYSGNIAVTKASGMMKSPTTYEMALMDNEANIHNGATPMYTEDYLQRIRNNDPNPVPHPLYGGWMLFFTNTDWLGELLENGFQQKHNLSVSGGGNKSNYFLSAGYVDQRGVVKYADDNNKRFNLRLNYDYSFFDRVKLETKVSVEDQKRTAIGGIGDWVIGEAIFGMPNHPIYTPAGNYFAQGGWSNAIAMAKEGETATYKTKNINTNFKLIIDLLTDLKLNLQAGINQSSTKSKDPATSVPLYRWDEKLAYYGIANEGQEYMNEANEETLYQNYTAYFQYSKLFSEKHSLDVMGGLSHEKNEFDTFSAWRDGFGYKGLWAMDLGSTDNMKNSGRGDHWAISSLFGRIGYSYKSKYLVESNFRYDGSSRFSGADKRWGLFPGVSAGWRISQESFMKDLTFIDDLKIRASYGETGNQEGIGLYDFIQKMRIKKNRNKEVVYYPFGSGSQTQALQLDGMVAYNRTWETIVNQNVGIDLVVLNQRMNVSFDYFLKRNKDMLIPVIYPSLLGDKAPSSNAGEMKTWGWEANLMWKDKVGSFNYFVKLVVSDAQNKVTNYGGDDTYKLGLNEIREGYPLNSYFAYEFDGLIRTQQELDEYKKLGGVPSDIGIGDARFKDLNGDGKISTYGEGDDGDVKYVGTSTPRFNFGITTGGSYKNFDFNLFFQGVGNRTLFRTGDYSMPWSDWWRQPPHFYYNQTWSKDRPDAYYPRLSHGDIRYWNYQVSTLQKINAAYIRLKNIQVGYSIPTSLLKKVSINRARVYFSGQDIWETHSIKGGWDPESVDWGGNYPFQRYYSFGIDLTF